MSQKGHGGVPGLPDVHTGQGMVYQVWSVTCDGQMISAGAFTPADDGHTAAVLNGRAAAVEQSMITLEPPVDRSTRPERCSPRSPPEPW